MPSSFLSGFEYLPVVRDVMQFWNFKIEISAAASDTARQWYVPLSSIDFRNTLVLCGLPRVLFLVMQVVLGRRQARVSHKGPVASA
jgi:hypothetical protein